MSSIPGNNVLRKWPSNCEAKSCRRMTSSLYIVIRRHDKSEAHCKTNKQKTTLHRVELRMRECRNVLLGKNWKTFFDEPPLLRHQRTYWAPYEFVLLFPNVSEDASMRCDRIEDYCLFRTLLSPRVLCNV